MVISTKIIHPILERKFDSSKVYFVFSLNSIYTHIAGYVALAV